jgi:signal transduction histidine kinase
MSDPHVPPSSPPSSTSRLALWRRVAIVVALWALALTMTIALAPFIQRSAFIFFWVAVLGAAWFAGLRTAIASAIAAVVAVNYLFVPPVGVLDFQRLGATELIQLGIFVSVSSIMSALLSRLENARRRSLDDAAVQAELVQQLQEQAVTLEEQATMLEEQTMELERQNEELQELADDAAAANRAKSEFLATMSHELRTPINAALGYVDLLETELHGPVTSAQREDLGRIRRSQRRLLSLVTDVLSFARLESARLELHAQDVALATLLPHLEESIAPLAAARGVRYTCAAPEPSLVVHADPDRLEQVLLNLLANAVKFTEPGGEVSLRAERRDGLAAIVVHDTGRGIPNEKLEQIFEPFVQVDSSLTRTAEGTGLGLAISRALTRAMGGEVTVESVLGDGSTFTVTVPLARVVAGPSPLTVSDAESTRLTHPA